MATPTDAEVRTRYGLAPDARIARVDGGDRPERVRLTPDSFTVVTLRSALERAEWERPVAVAGTTVRLLVRGAFVGEGAPVVADVTDAQGRRIARPQAPMHRDEATVEVALPRDAEGVAVAVVRVADLGIEATSGPLVVLPWIELTPRWEQAAGGGATAARAGETLALVVRVDARRDLLPELEGAAVRLSVRTGTPPEPVVTLRGTVRDREVRVEWAAALPGARLDIATQALLDRMADRAGAPRRAAPYRFEAPALTFEAELHTARAVSPALPVLDPLALTVVDVATGAAAAGRAVTLVWADGAEEQQTLDGEGRLALADKPPGPVQVRLPPADGAAEAGPEPPPPDGTDVVADVPATPGVGHVALVPTAQRTHLRLLPFVLSP